MACPAQQATDSTWQVAGLDSELSICAELSLRCLISPQHLQAFYLVEDTIATQ